MGHVQNYTLGMAAGFSLWKLAVLMRGCCCCKDPMTNMSKNYWSLECVSQEVHEARKLPEAGRSHPVPAQHNQISSCFICLSSLTFGSESHVVLREVPDPGTEYLGNKSLNCKVMS